MRTRRALLGLAATIALAAGGGSARADDVAPRGGIEGVVLADAMPVARAAVTLRRGVDPDASPDGDDRVAYLLAILDAGLRDEAVVATTTTDERGRFVFADVALGAYAVDVTASTASGPVVGLAAPIEVDSWRWTFAAIAASKPVSIPGRVLDSAGRPPAGRVLLSLAQPEGSVYPRVLLRTAAVGPQGTFALDAVPALLASPLEVTLARPGSRLATTHGPRHPDGSTAAWTVPAVVARRVRVTGEDGVRISGAGVIAEAEFDQHRALAGGRTDASGFVDLLLPADAAGVLRVAAAGHVPRASRFEKGRDPIEFPVRAADGSEVGRVVGRVLDGRGQPVAGAAVHVLEASGAFLVHAARTRAVSRADGHFVVDDVKPGPVWLCAIGAGFVSPRLSQPSEPPPPSQIVTVAAGGETRADVAVVPAASLAGVVRGEDGAPVPGALLRWSAISGTVEHESDWLPPSERKIAAGPDGRFSIPTLAPRTRILVEASAAGFARGEQFVDVEDAAGRADVTLGRSRALVVRVRDDTTGAPIPYASVQLRRDDPRMADADVFHSARRTDGAGDLVVGGIPRGPVLVDARHLAYLDAPELPVRDPGDATVVVSLRLGLAITGVVRDAAGRAVADANVWAESAANPSGRRRLAQTGADGRFRLEGLAAGLWNLSVDAGPVHAASAVQAGTSDVVLAPRGADDARGPVVVRVVGPDDKPVPLASIVWSSESSSGEAYVVDGKAELDSYEPQDPAGWTIAISAPTDASRKPLPFGPARVGPLAGASREVLIRLPAAGRLLRGRVTTPDGKPAGKVQVLAFGGGTMPGSWSRVFLGRADVDEKGEFSLPSVSTGSMALTAKSDDPLWRYGVVDAVAVRPDANDVVVPLALRESAAITVQSADGKPVAGATVTAERAALGDPERHSVRTGDDGVARLEGLVTGARYALVAGGPSLSIERLHWLPGDDLLRVGAGPLVTGVVKNVDGSPRGGLEIRVREEGHSAFFKARQRGLREPLAITRADGTFEFEIPDGGKVELEAGDAVLLTKDLVPTPFEASADRRRLSIVASGRVTMRLGLDSEAIATRLRPDGASIDAWLTLEHTSFSWDDTTQPEWVRFVSEDGVFRLHAIVGGARYWLWLPAVPPGTCALVSFVAKEGGVIHVDLVPSVEVTGRAVLPRGALDVQVTARGEGFRTEGTLGPDGSWSVRGLPPDHDVRVRLETLVGDVRWAGEATVVPGTPLTIETKPVPR